MTDKSGKPRYSKAEASEKLIASAIELMRTNPIGKVSALKICAHAGLDKMTVRYCFGSFAGLLIATVTTLGLGISRHVHDGVFDETAYSDPDSVLFGKLVAFLFASLDDELPNVQLDQLPNFRLIENQIAETYDIQPELARALAKRTALVAVATVALERFIPVTERERTILARTQRRFLSDIATVQDDILK